MTTRYTSLLRLVEKVGGILAVTLYLAALGLFLFQEPLTYRICGEFINSVKYGTCTTLTKHVFLMTLYGALIIATFLACMICVWSVTIRKLIRKYIKYYATASAAILLLSYFAQSCFMYSCSSLLPLGGVLVAGITMFLPALLLGYAAFPNSRAGRATLVFLSIVVAGIICAYAGEIKNLDKERSNKLKYTHSAVDCHKALFRGEEDACLFNVGVVTANTIVCDQIYSADDRQSCHDFIIRNKAIKDLNPVACGTIVAQDQRQVCLKLITETIERNVRSGTKK